MTEVGKKMVHLMQLKLVAPSVHGNWYIISSITQSRFPCKGATSLVLTSVSWLLSNLVVQVRLSLVRLFYDGMSWLRCLNISYLEQLIPGYLIPCANRNSCLATGTSFPACCPEQEVRVDQSKLYKLSKVVRVEWGISCLKFEKYRNWSWLKVDSSLVLST